MIANALELLQSCTKPYASQLLGNTLHCAVNGHDQNYTEQMRCRINI